MMKTKIFLIAFFLSQIALSQTIVKSSIDNGGASISNSNIALIYTIGEVNVQEITVGDISISEGFIGSNLNSTNNFALIPDVEILPDLTEECESTPTAPTATNGYGDTFTATPDITLPITTQGTIEITWTYDDGNGNTATQTQNVVIDDVTAPVSDLELLLDVIADCEVIELTPPTATDNCQATVVITHDAILPISGEGTTTVVTWTYDDGNGNTVDQTQNVIVNNKVPVISKINISIDPVPINSFVPISIEYEDNNLIEAVIDWGDGFQTYGDVASGLIIGDHMYSTPGVYNLEILILDSCGKSDSYIYQYMVAYDPYGGFVTGGGWINSPLGAYTVNPLLEGKANFGFVAKYKKGQTVPSGNTEFQFKAGDLNFNSSLFDWLVIAGSKAKFKGEGTINGTGSFGFMISAIDEDNKDKTDKFRIKIWDKVNEEAIVYDNQIGEEDNSDPTTEIAGGAIVVHSKSSKNNDPVTTLSDDVKFSEIKIYPNPFSNSVLISLQFKESKRMTIEVYDLSGKLIEKLYYGSIEKDINYNFEFKPQANLKNGIYIVKFIMANGSVHTKKLLLER